MPDPSSVDDYLKSLGITPSAGGGTATTAKPANIPPLPPELVARGFEMGRDGKSAYVPSFPFGTGRNAHSGPAEAYYDTSTGRWSNVFEVNPTVYQVGMGRPAGASGGTQAGGATTGQQAQPQSGANPQVSTPSPALGTTQRLYTPDRNLNNVVLSNGRNMPTQAQFAGRPFDAPLSYIQGPSGFSIQSPNGPAFQAFQFGYGPTSGTVDPLAAVGGRTQSSFQPTGTPFTPTTPMPGASVGGPAPAPAPAPAPVTGTGGGEVTGQVAQAMTPAPAPQGGIDLSAYHGSWLPDGSAWFPIQGGKTLPADIVDKVSRAWADTPQNIPTALAIATRESGGNPRAQGTNGPETGAPGTKDTGVFQINDIHLQPGGAAAGLSHADLMNPDTNIEVARKLFDQSQGFGPWGGADVYNPRGYPWAQGLERGAPPPDAIGPVKEVAQSFEARPVVPPINPPAPSNPNEPASGRAPNGGGGGSWGAVPGPAVAQGQGGGAGGGGSFGVNPLNPAAAGIQVQGNPPGVEFQPNPLNPLNPLFTWQGSPNWLDRNAQYAGLGQVPWLETQVLRNENSAPSAPDFLARAQQAAGAARQPVVLDSGAGATPPPAAQAYQQSGTGGGPGGSWLDRAKALGTQEIPPAIGQTTAPPPPVSGTGPNVVDALGQWANQIGNLMRGVAATGQPPPTAGPGVQPQTQPQAQTPSGTAWLTGPQTYEIRNGGTGYGANALTILQGFGRAPTNDALTNANMAIQLQDAQRKLMDAGMDPLSARDYLMQGQNPENLPIGGTAAYNGGFAGPEMVQRTDAGYWFTPGSSQINPGGSPTSSGYQSGVGGMGGDGSTRFLAGGGSFITGSMEGIRGGYGEGRPQAPLADPIALRYAIQRMQQNQTGYVPRPGVSSGPTQRFASGGSFLTTQPTMFPMANGGRAVTSEYGQPEMVTVTPLQGYASGGSFITQPKPGSTTYDAPPPPSTGTDQTNTGQINYDYGTPQAPTTEAGGSNTPQAPTDLNYNAPPATPAPPQTPTILGGDFAGALATNPELRTQQEIARQQGLRDQYGYLYRAAGVGSPIGISSRDPLTGLPPSQFWQPVDYSGQIQQLQARLAALGPVSGDPAELQQALVAAQNGYGGNGPGQPGWINPDPVRAAQIEMQLRNMTEAADLMNQIANLRANQPQVIPGVVGNAPALDQPIGPVSPLGKGIGPGDPGLILAMLNSAGTPGQPAKRRDPLAAVA